MGEQKKRKRLTVAEVARTAEAQDTILADEIRKLHQRLDQMGVPQADGMYDGGPNPNVLVEVDQQPLTAEDADSFRKRILEIFEIDERDLAALDMDGYQEARAEADAQREAFVASLKEQVSDPHFLHDSGVINDHPACWHYNDVTERDYCCHCSDMYAEVHGVPIEVDATEPEPENMAAPEDTDERYDAWINDRVRDVAMRVKHLEHAAAIIASTPGDPEVIGARLAAVRTHLTELLTNDGSPALMEWLDWQEQKARARR